MNVHKSFQNKCRDRYMMSLHAITQYYKSIKNCKLTYKFNVITSKIPMSLMRILSKLQFAKRM